MTNPTRFRSQFEDKTLSLPRLRTTDIRYSHCVPSRAFVVRFQHLQRRNDMPIKSMKIREHDKSVTFRVYLVASKVDKIITLDSVEREISGLVGR